MLDMTERLTHEEEIIYGNAIQKAITAMPKGYKQSDIPMRIRKMCERMVLCNKGLSAKEARKFSRNEEDFKDLYQEGLIGLQFAALKFDPSLGNRFSTYAMWWVKQRIFRYSHRGLVTVPVNIGCKARRIHRKRRDLSIKLQRQVTRQEIIEHLLLDGTISDVAEYDFLLTIDRPIMTLDKPMGDGDITMMDMIPAPMVESQNHNTALDKIIASLPSEQVRVLELRYGLNGHVAHTKSEAALVLGMSMREFKSHDRKAMRTFRSAQNKALLQRCA